MAEEVAGRPPTDVDRVLVASAGKERNGDAPGTGGRRPRRLVLSDKTYEAIKAMVMNNEIPPGARVNIDALAHDLRVSQTPVREALARLEADDLVRKEPLRGYRTTPLLTTEEFTDLYELRLLLEGWAAERAARHITPQGGAALLDELESVRTVPSGNEYAVYRSVTDHDTRFHSLVFELAGNDVVRGAWERTHCHLHLFRLFYAGMLGTRALVEHRLIAQAISAGDVEGAVAAMRAHIEASRARLLPATSPAPSPVQGA